MLVFCLLLVFFYEFRIPCIPCQKLGSPCGADKSLKRYEKIFKLRERYSFLGQKKNSLLSIAVLILVGTSVL